MSDISFFGNPIFKYVIAGNYFPITKTFRNLLVKPIEKIVKLLKIFSYGTHKGHDFQNIFTIFFFKYCRDTGTPSPKCGILPYITGRMAYLGMYEPRAYVETHDRRRWPPPPIPGPVRNPTTKKISHTTLTLKWVSGKTRPHHAEIGNCHLSVTVTRETLAKRTDIDELKTRESVWSRQRRKVSVGGKKI